MPESEFPTELEEAKSSCRTSSGGECDRPAVHFSFRSRRADRLKLLYWDGTGLVMAYKRLEEASFTWPAIKDGLMALNHAQFEALFAGLDWRKVKALEARPPAAAE